MLDPLQELDDILDLPVEDPTPTPSTPQDLLPTSSPRGRQRRRWYPIILGGLLLVLLVMAGLFFALRQMAPSPTYYYQKPTLGTLTLTVSATGPLQGTLYNADFAVSGKLSEIDVKEGQTVKADQVLAKLDPASIQTGGPPGLQSGSTNTDLATLIAPHAGTVTAIRGAVGGRLGGTTINGSSPFIQLVDLSTLQIRADVNESDIAKVAVGNAVQFTVSAYGDQMFKGKVSTLVPFGQSASGVVTYPAIINVDMKILQNLGDVHLLPGMTASVTIITTQHSKVLLIPAAAVTFAQEAANPTTRGIITPNQAQIALAQARQMLATLQTSKHVVTGETPTPAYVLERVNAQWVVKPVVLGLTDDTSYEVLAGLSTADVLVIGEQGKSSTVHTFEHTVKTEFASLVVEK